MKTAVVTGGAGFIGSHVCERLHKEGWKVISLDNYFTGVRENHIEGVEYREGHTKDIESLVPETPDIVYHLAGYSRVERSFEEPALVWSLNSDGTFAVAEYCRKKNVKLVYAGSSTRFADGSLGPHESPYAWTKANSAELIANYGTWFGLPYAITYFYNVYGPRERAGRYGTVIEIFRQKYLNGESLSVNSPGTQVRNFTHVYDIVDGLMLVGEKGSGDGYGLGDHRTYSILDIAKQFGLPVTMMPSTKGNRMNSSIDTSKSEELGWKVKHSVVDYIESIVKKP